MPRASKGLVAILVAAGMAGCDLPTAARSDASYHSDEDQGPFEFVSFERIWTNLLPTVPNPVTTSTISSTGAVSNSDGCQGSGTAPASVLEPFVKNATAPHMVAAFLVNTPCSPELSADETAAAVLTLANRTTFKRLNTCDSRVAQLMNDATVVERAACAP